MNTIKIVIEALGGTGDSYDVKKTRIEKIVEKTSTKDQLEEIDLENIVKTIISTIKEIKTQYPEEQTDVIFHHNNRLSEIKMTIEIINKENKSIDSFDERSLFNEVAEYESLSQLILDYYHITDDGEEGSRIWLSHEYDEGPPAGTHAILALAMRNKKWIPNYIDFLRTCDLDHETEQMWHIKEVVEKHGWCEETCCLAVARAVSCSGQAGGEQFEKFLKSGLNDYLKIQENRTMFVENVVQEFKEATSLEYSYHHSILDSSKESFLKEIAMWVAFFEMALTEKEMEILNNEVSLIWDRFNLIR